MQSVQSARRGYLVLALFGRIIVDVRMICPFMLDAINLRLGAERSLLTKQLDGPLALGRAWKPTRARPVLARGQSNDRVEGRGVHLLRPNR